jgi:hypothetical protein
VSGWFASEESASLPAYLLIATVAPITLWPAAAVASVLARTAPAPFGEHGRRLWPAYAGVLAVAAVNGFWWVSASGAGLDRNYPVLVLTWAAGLQAAAFLALAWLLNRRPRTRPLASHTLIAGAVALAGWIAGGTALALLHTHWR